MSVQIKTFITMNRREFSKNSGILGLGLMAGSSLWANNLSETSDPGFFKEQAKKIPKRYFDVVVAGGGTVVPMEYPTAHYALKGLIICMPQECLLHQITVHTCQPGTPFVVWVRARQQEQLRPCVQKKTWCQENSNIQNYVIPWEKGVFILKRKFSSGKF